MTHTPRPWTIDPQGIVYDEDSIPIIIVFGPMGPGHGRVAMVYAEYGREEELFPNAHIITAAPELLKELKEAVEYFEADYDRPDWFDGAMKAIAKAEAK